MGKSLISPEGLDENEAREMLVDLERHANQPKGAARNTAQDVARAISERNDWWLAWANKHHQECELDNCAPIIGLINIIQARLARK